MAILMLGKADFKTKNIIRDRVISHEDRRVNSLKRHSNEKYAYTINTGESSLKKKREQNQKILKEEQAKPQSTGDFNIPLSAINRKSRPKNQ